MKSKTAILIGLAFIFFVLIAYPYPEMRNLDYSSRIAFSQLLGYFLLDVTIVFAIPTIISFVVYLFDKDVAPKVFFIFVLIFCSVLWSFRPKNRALIHQSENTALQKLNVNFEVSKLKVDKQGFSKNSNEVIENHIVDEELSFPEDKFTINCNCDFRKDTYNSEVTMNTYQCFSYFDTCIYRVNVHNLIKMGLTKSEINNFINATIEGYKKDNTSFKEKLFGGFKAVEYFQHAPNNVTSKNLLLVANDRCYTFSMVSDSEKIKKHWTSFIESITITK